MIKAWLLSFGRAAAVAGLMLLGGTAGAAERELHDVLWCVEQNFDRQVARSTPLEDGQVLDLAAIQIIASRVTSPMREALTAAGQLATRSSDDVADARRFFDQFADAIGGEMERRIQVKECGEAEVVEGALHIFGIHHYFDRLIGRGKVYQWFSENGGPYAYTISVAAMVAMELAGKHPNVEAWKSFYTPYVTKKFVAPREARP